MGGREGQGAAAEGPDKARKAWPGTWSMDRGGDRKSALDEEDPSATLTLGKIRPTLSGDFPLSFSPP